MRVNTAKALLDDAAAVDYLDHDDLATLLRALRTAVDSARDDEATLRLLARSIAAGEHHPLFAAGEAGVRAVERLADAHQQSVADFVGLHERLMGANELLAVATD